jgi:transcriptional regulator with XRE-family HTH domain
LEKFDSFGAAFGRLVRLRRGEKGWSQSNLATFVFADRTDPQDEKHKSDVSKLESGRTTNPQARLVNLYAKALGITQSEIETLRRTAAEANSKPTEQLRLTLEYKRLSAVGITEAAIVGLAQQVNAQIDSHKTLGRSFSP